MNRTITALLLCSAACTATAEIMVPMHLVNEQGVGEGIGHITVSQTTHGIQLKPDLRDLPPGMRGFHLHEKATVRPPKKTAKLPPREPRVATMIPTAATSTERPGATATRAIYPVYTSTPPAPAPSL